MPSEADDGCHDEQNGGTDVTDNVNVFDGRTTHWLHIILAVQFEHYASLSILDCVFSRSIFLIYVSRQ